MSSAYRTSGGGGCLPLVEDATEEDREKTLGMGYMWQRSKRRDWFNRNLRGKTWGWFIAGE